MRQIQSALGYTMAIGSIVVAFTTLVGIPYFSQVLVDETGITVSPWMNGGDVARTIDHGDYETAIHETVFQGLFSERRKGFVQIDWVKKIGLPAEITEDIDFDGDQTVDFSVRCDPENDQATVTPYNPCVHTEPETFVRENGFTIRVWLDGPATCVNNTG